MGIFPFISFHFVLNLKTQKQPNISPTLLTTLLFWYCNAFSNALQLSFVFTFLHNRTVHHIVRQNLQCWRIMRYIPGIEASMRVEIRYILCITFIINKNKALFFILIITLESEQKACFNSYLISVLIAGLGCKGRSIWVQTCTSF